MNPFSSALDLASAIRDRTISPLEVVETYLDRIDRLNPKLNAFVWRRDDELIAEAKRATEAVAKGETLGPFHGVPIPIKDLTDVEGWPTTFGSRAGLGRIATVTLSVVESLRKAGFLLMGRTNTPEFGTLPVTENDAHGATRNPWNPDHTPGGSSGAAAAAVASGMAPIAHGNDGGGSLRIPASCCGLVGLKPARGRIPMGPPLVNDVMHGGCVEGVITRTVADTAASLDVLAHEDPLGWYNAPPPSRPFAREVGADPGRLRIAFETTPPTGVPVAAECVRAVERAAALLAELGHEVFEGGPPWQPIDEAFQSFMAVWNTGTAYWDVDDWSKIEPCNAAMRALAQQTDSISYARGVLGLQHFGRRLVASWGRDFDLLLTPTLASEPVRVGALFAGVETDPMAPLMNSAAFAAFTPLFNSTGQPAISLPLHWSEAGLPVGVQLVGKPWGEAELIRIAAQLEQAAPWAERRPPIS